MSKFLPSLVAIPILLAGCVGPAADSVDPTDLPRALETVLTLLDKKGFRIDQPVDVYVVGFEAAVAAKLQATLQPEEVYGAASDVVINFPPTAEGTLGGSSLPLPAIPRAVYRVHDVPEDFAHAFFANVSARSLGNGALDANAAEDFLAKNLLEEEQSRDPNRPAFVLLHGQDDLPENHAWRYSYPHGWLEPVRAFGERNPFVVYDVSAKPDPYVTENRFSPEGVFFRTVFGDNPVKAYNFPLAPGGDETVRLLAELTVDATHYRLLQPALYPISTKPCHHITFVMGIETASLTEALSLGPKARALVDLDGIRSGFENLTASGVTIDLNVLMLPQDDPALDALMRTAANGVFVAFPFLDAMRFYLDQNWEKYVTHKTGCEEYLSLFLFGDLATKGDFGGMGTYDVTADRRISFSLWPELNRLRATYEGPGRDVLRTTPDSEDPWNTLNVLVAHETGHLFGQHHPQHVQHAAGESPQIDTFQSVWSVMSYETDWRVHEFSDIDAANWQRNRAGYAVQRAQLSDQTGTDEFAEAIQALEAYRWGAAYDALSPILANDAALETYHAGASHPHQGWAAMLGT